MVDFTEIESEKISGDFVKLIMAPLSEINFRDLLWERNPKKHDIGGIWESIKKYGYIDPAKIDANLNGGKGGIVYGNGRFETLISILIEAKGKGESPPRGIGIAGDEWYVPIMVGCDQESESIAIALGIDHNNLTMSGSDYDLADITKLWEQDEYIALLTSIADQNVLPITVDADALGSLLAGLERSVVEECEEGLEELLEDAEGDDYAVRVKPGEIWKLGRHYIACGDCCEVANIDVLKRAGGVDKISMVWADPPYGYSYQSNMRTVTQKFDVIENDDKILEQFIFPICSQVSGWILICTAWKVLAQWMAATSLLGKMSNLIVWDKGGGGMRDLTHSLLTDYELILAFGQGSTIKGKRLGSVWDCGKDRAVDYVHPTQKPVALAIQAFQCFSEDGDTIIDPFLGSGISLIAAEQLGDRTVIGFELSEKYCSIICDRWEKLTGGTAEKVGDL